MRHTGVITAAASALLLAACASTPKTYLLVPSRESLPQLRSLSHQSGTTVSVLTVQRTQRTFQLGDAADEALSGMASAEGPAVSVPFDEAALVYYSKGDSLASDRFPLLPAVSAAERNLDCDGLKVELGRTEAIRWLARQQGGVPFTAHEAAMQHGKSVLAGAGVAVLAVVVLAGCSSGACGGFGNWNSPSPHPAVDIQTYRWAVTRADKREIGLLGLSRDKHCPARPTGAEPGTDLAVLEQVGSSRQQLEAHALDEKQQMILQTRWLDRLYGSQAAGLAPFPEETGDDLTGRVIVGVRWGENEDVQHHALHALSHLHRQGSLAVRADDMTLSGVDVAQASDTQDVVVRYTDLSDAEVAHFGRWRGVVLTFRDGRKDSLEFSRGQSIDRDETERVGRFLKARIRAAAVPAAAVAH